MAQGDMNIANQGFPAFRADLNEQLEALVTNSSGATAPATTFPHQWWLDTSTTPNTLRQRNAANDAWIVVGLLNQSTNTFNVPVAQGGTGLATLTANNVLLGNGTSAVQAVAPGTSGNVLTSNGTTWTSAALPTGGKVLQVVQGTLATVVSSSSSTYADTGLTATITPTSATSKILVIVNHTGCGKAVGDTSLRLRLLRGSTEINVFELSAAATSSTATNVIGGISTAYLDSPSTTSPVSYKTQLASTVNIATVFVQNNSCNGTITLLEIAA